MSEHLALELRNKPMAVSHSTFMKPDFCLHRTLWHLGFRYMGNDKHLPLPSPDFVIALPLKWL